MYNSTYNLLIIITDILQFLETHIQYRRNSNLKLLKCNITLTLSYNRTLFEIDCYSFRPKHLFHLIRAIALSIQLIL